jgi:predicted MFS family arabinose efflux permease
MRGQPRRSALHRQIGAARAVLRAGSLRDCQLSLALARTTDLAQLVAVSAYLFDNGGLTSVAAYGVIRTIAPAAAVPVMTALTGRVGHGRLLWLLALLAAAASAVTVVVLVADGSSVVVLVLGAVIGIALGSFRPIMSALMPSLVSRPDQLVACTASAGFLDGVTSLAGPLLAGVLLGVAGPAWTVGTTTALLVAAALLAGRLPVPRTIPDDEIVSSSSEGFASVFRRPEALVIAVLVPCQTFVRGALNVIVVVFAIDALQRDDSSIGLLLGAIGAGGVLASPIAIGVVSARHLYRALGLGLALWGLPLAITSGRPAFAVILLLFAVIGVGNVLIDIGAFTALARAVPDPALAKAFGVLESLLQVGMALGAVIAGVLLDQFGPRVALLSVGLLLPAVAAISAPLLIRFDAQLEHRDVEADLLRRQALFADLPMPVIDRLSTRLEPVEFAAGERILTEGDHGDRYLIIAEGTVDFTQRGAMVNSLDAGSGFGEIALVRDVRRTATATARTRVLARTLDRSAFLGAMGCDPRARAAADAVADERLARTPASDGLET